MPKLTLSERWILANQYRILELLDPEHADRYQLSATIIENGYEDHYDQAANMNVDHPSLDPAIASEVRDILQMFREMQWAAEKITEEEILKSPLFEFWGFDGNNNGEHLSYATFLHEIGEYKELDNRPTWDSHSDTIAMYRLMVEAWKALPHDHRGIKMRKEDVQAILDAGRVSMFPDLGDSTPQA